MKKFLTQTSKFVGGISIYKFVLDHGQEFEPIELPTKFAYFKGDMTIDI